MTKGIFDNVCALILAAHTHSVHTQAHTIKALCFGSVAVGLPASWVRGGKQAGA